MLIEYRARGQETHTTKKDHLSKRRWEKHSSVE